MTRRLDEFVEAIRRLPASPTVDDACSPELALYGDDRIRMFYAPFDFINASAAVAIVGVTPGPTQIVESLVTVRAALAAGESQDDALRAGKHRASFKGMRRDLARWMDEIGLGKRLRVSSCADLFGDARMLHTTSAIRYPTFSRKRDGEWIRYSGSSPDILGHPALVGMIEETLLPELRGLPEALVVPLGKANRAVQYLVDEEALEPDRCVLGLPHPSPASAFRERYFQAAKDSLIGQVRGDGRPVRGAPVTRTPAASAAREDQPAPDPAAATGSPSDSIEITLTQGNLNNNHIYLGRHLDFFPPDAVGQPNSKDGLGRQLTVVFAGVAGPITTDIAGKKLFFRARRPIGEFFRRNALKAGDRVRIVQTGRDRYCVEPVR